jgi:hypothetical protein
MLQLYLDLCWLLGLVDNTKKAAHSTCVECLGIEISDVIGLDWSWIRGYIQSSPEVKVCRLQELQYRSGWAGIMILNDS